MYVEDESRISMPVEDINLARHSIDRGRTSVPHFIESNEHCEPYDGTCREDYRDVTDRGPAIHEVNDRSQCNR